MALGISVHCGAEAGSGYDVEFERAFAIGQRDLQYRLVRSIQAQQLCIVRHGLDVQAAPTVFVKGFADRVNHRVLGAHVDVTALPDVLEGAPKHHVFKILRV